MAVSTLLGTGTTGVTVFQEGLKVIGNNIANTDTVGFKENDIAFSELIAGGIAGMGKLQMDKFQVGRGATVNSIRNIFSQGSLEQTQNALDLTIEGEGFFMLKDPSGSTIPLYTRAGVFDDGRNRKEEGKFGLVVNPDGFLLQGAKVTGVDPVTGKPTLGKVDSMDLSDHLLQPSATSKAHFTLNLFGEDAESTQEIIGSEPTNLDVLNGGALAINGVGLGEILDSLDAAQRVEDLIAEINAVQDITGVVASKASDTTLMLTSLSGGPINVKFDLNLDPDVAAKTGLQEGSLLAAGLLTGTLTSEVGTRTIGGVGTRFKTEIAAGDRITVGESQFTVASVQSDTKLTVTGDMTADVFDAQGIVQKAAFTTPVTFFDSLGKDHVVNMRFVKTGTNAWQWNAIVSGSDNQNGSFDEVQATGTLGFTSTGELDAAKMTPAVFPTDGFDFKGGSSLDQKITFDFLGTSQQVKNGATQFGDPTGPALINSTQDGFSSAPLNKVFVDSEGFINGQYTNGQVRKLYQVMLAKFPNQEGLRRAGKNLYIQSDLSGEAILGAAGSVGRGEITANNLEKSTVDLTKQFVSLITYQRGFQANSRVIVTADEVVQEIVNLKR